MNGEHASDDTVIPKSDGVSLRDYIAANAMAGYIAAPGVIPPLRDLSATALWSYAVADAMIAERAKHHLTKDKK